MPITLTADQGMQAIQDALRQSPRKRIVLDEGMFVISQPLILPSGTTLCGQGQDTLLRRANGFYGNLIDTEAHAKDVCCRDFDIDDAPLPADLERFNTRCMALHYTDVQGGAIERVRVRNTYRWGIFLTSGSDLLVDRCEASDAHGVPLNMGGGGGHGICLHSPYASGLSEERGRRIRISRCVMNRCMRTGFYGQGVDGLIVEGCTANDCAWQDDTGAPDTAVERGGPIAVAHGATNVVIANNVIGPSFSGQGIEIDVTDNLAPEPHVTQHITVSGNQISGQGYSGIVIYCFDNVPENQRSAHCVVSGNVLVNNNRRGNLYYGAIHAFSALRDFSIIGNVVTDDARGCPGIRTTDRDFTKPGAPEQPGSQSNRYTIAHNRVTLANQQLISAKAALDESMVIGGSRITVPNILTVNGRAV